MKTGLTDQPILIAGFGSAGRRHFRNLRALGYDSFVFYRSYQCKLTDAEIADWPAFTDLDAALARRPNIAIIANPTALHLAVAIPAARAGCHLFIEKPLSHTLAGCSELAALVEQKKLTTMIGCQFRFHPLLIALREQLQAGRIGEVIGARAEWGEYLPDWHPWEDHHRSYSALQALGGGAILTLIHPLDYLYWLFGSVKNVHASMRQVASLHTDTDDDLAEITLEFASGVVGQVHLDYIQRPPVHTLAVWGDAGRATLDYHAGTLHWESGDGDSQVEQAPAGFERNTLFVDELQHFLACVERGQATRIPLKEGIAVLEIALQAKQDARSRKQSDAIH